MAKAPNTSTAATPGSATGAARRKLLTTRGANRAPPRVVLHLPDLEALATVAVGPRKRGERRRVDAAHAAPAAAPYRGREDRRRSDVEAEDSDARSGLEVRHLVRNVLGHVEKLSGRSVAGGSTLLQIAALLQKPKVMAAGVAAIGLQLAALLAMFFGESKPTNDAASPDAKHSSAPTIADHLPPLPNAEAIGVIQTPLTTMPSSSLPAAGGFSLPLGAGPNSGQARTPPQIPGPAVVAQPKLPPLPILDSRDLPPWDQHDNFVVPPSPRLAAPGTPSPSPAANGPLPELSARSVASDSAVATTESGTTSSSTGATDSGGSRSILSLPTMPSSDGPKSTPAVQVSQPGTGRPKARLNGTIQKVTTGGGPQ